MKTNSTKRQKSAPSYGLDATVLYRELNYILNHCIDPVSVELTLDQWEKNPDPTYQRVVKERRSK